MTEIGSSNEHAMKDNRRSRTGASARKRVLRRLTNTAIWIGVAVLLLACSAAWLASKAVTINSELKAANTLLVQLRADAVSSDPAAALATVGALKTHTANAREAASDPLWTLAGTLPWIGANFHALGEITTSSYDVVHLAASPLSTVFQTLDWSSLVPSGQRIDLDPLTAATPKIVAAAHAVRQSSDRLDSIDETALAPQISLPLVQARQQLGELADSLDASSAIATLAPDMFGIEGKRRYLLLIQNNSELRATGGIPGALAVLTAENGRFALETQTSAIELGTFSPPVSVDNVQNEIYSSRMGKFMQDVNLTPDFPTTARTAQEMWQRKTGEQLDGVVSLDPIALSYALKATGPISLAGDESLASEFGRMPSTLTAQNVVQTLLSDVYANIEKTDSQDSYFAAVTSKIFSALSSGQGDPKGLVEGVARGTAEGRILVWSASTAEQAVISKYALSGSISGPSIAPAQFGVYFNDGTGAKMDYYIKRTVQLVKECPRDGYGETTVRITSTNTAPADAAQSLPAYVTGNGVFGVPPGSVQTNIVAYGPVQSNVETAKLDGQKTQFAPHLHSSRPVGVVAIQLAPGESRTVDFAFGKIVQHAEPNLAVTPTVQDVKDVTLPIENASCD